MTLLTNTINITGLSGSNKINIVPPIATALLDCRLLPGTPVEQWLAEVRQIIQDDSIAVDVVLNFPPNESAADTPFHGAIMDAVRARFPSAGVTDNVEIGFTDSHFFREHQIVSYGFGPFPMTEDDRRRAHGNDERIPVAAFTEEVRLMWDIVYNFSRAQ